MGSGAGLGGGEKTADEQVASVGLDFQPCMRRVEPEEGHYGRAIAPRQVAPAGHLSQFCIHRNEGDFKYNESAALGCC